MSADQHDRDALERMLAASLRARSGDVEPTTELWHRVETKVNRSRKFNIAAWTAGVAVAALVGVTVIPNLLPDNDDREPVVTDPTPSEQPGVISGMPDTIVATDGSRFWLADSRTGDELADVFALNSEGEGQATAFAVRPGSTAEDLTVVWVNSAEGMIDLQWFNATCESDAGVPGKAAGVTGCSADFGVVAYVGEATSGESPRIAFSPDGSTLAWVGELGGQNGVTGAGQGLNVATFDLDNGTTSPIGNASAIELDEFADTAVTFAVESWNPAGNRVYVTGSDLSAWEIELTVSEGGTGIVGLQDVPGGATGTVIDLDEERGLLLQARGQGQGDTVFTLSDAAGAEVITETLQTNAPGDAWFEALGTGVIFHRVGETLLLDATDRDQVAAIRLGDDVIYAAFLPTNRGAGNPGPAPTETAVAADLPSVVIVDRDTGAVTVERDDEVVYTLVPGDSSEFRAAGIAVRPGATMADMDVVIWKAGEGFSEYGWVAVRDNEAGSYQRFPDTYQPAGLGWWGDRAPVFNPRGNHLAWTELSRNGGACTLRVIGWQEGPGTGRTADDNASWELQGCQEGAMLDLWTNEQEMDDSSYGSTMMFEVDFDNGDGTREPLNVLMLEVDEQVDGAISFRSTQLAGEPGHGSWTIAAGNGSDLRSGSNPNEPPMQIGMCCDADGSRVYRQMPAQFRTDLDDDGWLAWLSSSAVDRAPSIGGQDRSAVFGDGAGNAWIVTSDGNFHRIGFGEGTGRAVSHADVVD